MSTAQELMNLQRARFPALDSTLPSSYPLPRNGEPLMAKLPNSEPVAGLMARTSNPPGSLQRLWSTAENFELFPLLGEHPGDGMNALLEAWREQLAHRDVPDTDSACLVTWPSRDVRASRALLDHGFTPLSCLAVRTPARAPAAEPNGTVKMRRAGPADLDTVVELALAELEYAALVGGSVVRPDAARLKRNAVHLRLHSAGQPTSERTTSGRTGAEPVWLAERDGVPIALAECGWVDARRNHSGQRVSDGKWAYVNCVSVREQERGTGVGQQLMAQVHHEFAAAGVVGSYLYYNPANPLSSVFWPRQGYRPLWTIWEVRPATALR
ncbi:GNAT family N-acetyltransferase [Haloactinomyces albus]|uniref:GNAT superfamily N-acetyltransferase n=1 Tax=Haloactinomyces albus TaxID=1352928 RepID=A0AAE3Z8N3_9ACTN|nr:GNAT family N-acetyltransferase [Haloactinomyces albus]MDR7300392.1 GNAT superfamily N-acetyltransferase [Haloactinomyces albus]